MKSHGTVGQGHSGACIFSSSEERRGKDERKEGRKEGRNREKEEGHEGKMTGKKEVKKMKEGHWRKEKGGGGGDG